MSEKRLWIGALVVSMTLVASAMGQDEKNELTGMAGKIFISDRGVQGSTPSSPPLLRYGKGFSFEVNYARRLWVTQIYSLAVEVPAVFNLDEDLNAPGPLAPPDYKAFFVTPAVRANLFPTTAVSPWVSFGGGFGRISENSTLLYGGGKNPTSGSTSGVIQGGVGLDVKFSRRFYLRGEARDFYAGQADLPLAPTGKTRQHNYFVAGGLMWRF
jgi:hypothetical protein